MLSNLYHNRTVLDQCQKNDFTKPSRYGIRDDVDISNFRIHSLDEFDGYGDMVCTLSRPSQQTSISGQMGM